MRAVLGAIVVAFAVGLTGTAGAATPPTNASVRTVSPPVNATVIAQRCRCVERRWNGSCKLRVCRDRW